METSVYANLSTAHPISESDMVSSLFLRYAFAISHETRRFGFIFRKRVTDWLVDSDRLVLCKVVAFFGRCSDWLGSFGIMFDSLAISKTGSCEKDSIVVLYITRHNN